jgi:small subunit ribosomal protein S9
MRQVFHREDRRTVEKKEYFPNFAWKHDAIEPLKFTSLATSGCCGDRATAAALAGKPVAVRMGLSRAISRLNPELRPRCARTVF